MPVVRTSSKYQIAIPKHIRTKLGIRPGQEMAVTDRDGSVVLTPIPSDPIEYLCGIHEGRPSMTRELLEERARDLEHE